ncbi:hypothetical protein P775_19310 [Puniceibacterium antarcticum]|uniref:Uncharacterized protein n=1 Tax=Puniceibacterium antarcticum TaxID=1206336 RepID=A0A2G8RB15_9RHOB|nr:hypothetical protein P775_19310 [Puniceibacterium antarcticum]
MPYSRHSSATCKPPYPWRSIARIWSSLNLVIFIRVSSVILLRKFYVRIPLVAGRITALKAVKIYLLNDGKDTVAAVFANLGFNFGGSR